MASRSHEPNDHVSAPPHDAPRSVAPGDAAIPQAANASFPIVGIGASAGGVPALIAFFSAASSDAGIAYVVVQHLPPDHTSLMAEILTRHTAMPVQEDRRRHAHRSRQRVRHSPRLHPHRPRRRAASRRVGGAPRPPATGRRLLPLARRRTRRARHRGGALGDRHQRHRGRAGDQGGGRHLHRAAARVGRVPGHAAGADGRRLCRRGAAGGRDRADDRALRAPGASRTGGRRTRPARARSAPARRGHRHHPHADRPPLRRVQDADAGAAHPAPHGPGRARRHDEVHRVPARSPRRAGGADQRSHDQRHRVLPRSRGVGGAAHGRDPAAGRGAAAGTSRSARGARPAPAARRPTRSRC